jgi:hypothetical protein
VHLGYGPYIWLSVSKLPLQCAAVSLYSAVKQRLKCNTGKVRNCLIQFLLTVVLSIKARVFVVVECVFREGNLPPKFPEKPVAHRNAVRRLIERVQA